MNCGSKLRGTMGRIVFKRRIGDSGDLQLDLDLGREHAGRSVRITIEPVESPSGSTADEWRSWVHEMAGSWEGDFERPPQGEYEVREPHL
jgi:hypothetical protein